MIKLRRRQFIQLALLTSSSVGFGWPNFSKASKRKGTLENYERKFKETYESPSSQFRTKKLKEIGNEIKTINTTFSKRTRRGRIRKILEKN